MCDINGLLYWAVNVFRRIRIQYDKIQNKTIQYTLLFRQENWFWTQC